MSPARPLLPSTQHLLGDSAYPLSSCVLTPYRDNGYLDEQQRRYNVLQASCRSVIERAFGLLKVKFRRLKFLDIFSVETANLIVSASCTLHNFIIIHNQANIWEVNPADLEHDSDDDGDDIDLDGNGARKRDGIKDSL